MDRVMEPKRIILKMFEGPGWEVEHQVELYLAIISGYELVDVKYNYQAAEVKRDGFGNIDTLASATHGICLVLQEKESTEC